MIEAYKVGVSIIVTSNVSTILRAINGDVAALDTRFRTLKGVIQGALLFEAGKGLLHGLTRITKQAEDLNAAMVRMKALGGEFASDAGSALVMQTAAATQREVPTSVLSKTVDTEREVGSVIGLDKAISITPELMKFQEVAKRSGVRVSDADLLAYIRTVDLRGQSYTNGQFDPAKFVKELGYALNASILSGGLFNATAELAYTRQAGPAGRYQTPEAFYGAGAEVAMGMGGARTGTAEMSLFQQFLGGMMTTRAAVEMQRMGLFHEGDWKAERGGRIVVSPEATKRFAGIQTDPEAWIEKTLVPIFEKSHLSAQDAMAELFRLFGRQTTQRFVSDVMNNAPQVARGREFFKTMPDVDKNYAMLMSTSLKANLDALTASWTSLEQALGGPATKDVITVLQTLTSGINALDQVVLAHPEVGRGLTDFGWALTGVLFLGSALKFGTLALSGFSPVLRLFLATAGSGPVLAAGRGLAAVGIGLADIAGVTGVATLGGSLAAIGGGLTAIIAPAAALFALLKVGAAHETEATRQALENLRKGNPITPPSQMQLHDGFDAEGRPIHKQAYHAPMPSAHVLQIKLDEPLTVDGRVLTRLVSEGQARYMTLPPSGTSRFDTRMSPLAPGQQIDI